MIYVDTNVFIDRSDKSSAHYAEAKKFIDKALTTTLLITTSTETIQEIIYYGYKMKKMNDVVKICYLIVDELNDLLSVDVLTIREYLKFVHKYPKADSRDLIHLAACLANNIGIIITFDRDFKKFKEVRALTPGEYLKLV